MVDANDEPVVTVRRYYESLDAHDYGTLSSLLDPAFTHYRPDRTFEGREQFVQFMRDDRPMTDTTHELRGLFVPTEGERDIGDDADGTDSSGTSSTPEAIDDPGERAGPLVVARGRLLDCEGEHVFGFVDVHELATAGTIAATYTYTR